MKTIYTLIICLITASQLYGQDPCDDQNAIDFQTLCGDEFHLCMDRYVLEDHNSIELQVYTNDMGQIDKCESFICSPCSHGTLTKLPAPNCNYVYTPVEGFYGNDTFYYAMIINDSCNDDPCEGKIWTVNSRYKGPDGLNLKVYSKKDNSWDPVDEANDLQWGDYFLIDGSDLPVSQANWKYKFYEPEGSGGCTGEECLVEEVIVHTSCSQEIFGKDFGFFRVISGCTAGPNDGLNCIDSANKLASTNNTITTQYTDTTMVVLSIFEILPIEILEFKAISTKGENLISWNVANVTNEDYLDIEKSYDDNIFTSIKRVAPVHLGAYSFTDTDVKNNENIYYRLALVDLDGNKKYSNVIRVTGYDITKIKLYPNPTNNDITIETGNEALKIFKFAILSLNGKTIVQKTISPSSTQTIQLSNYELNTGIYLLRISTDDGQMITKEVMYSKDLNR